MNIQELIDELTSPLNTEDECEKLMKQFQSIKEDNSDNDNLISEVDRFLLEVGCNDLSEVKDELFHYRGLSEVKPSKR